MEQTTQRKESLMPESIVTSKIAAVRLAVGLLQGLVLYILYHAAKSATWPATDLYLFAPLLLVSVIAPVILISSLGHLDRRKTAVWIAVTLIIIAALGIHDIWRGGASNDYWFNQGANRVRFPSPLLIVFSVAGFFIAHTFVLAGASDKRRIARYPTYFETGWKLLIQIKFSLLFVGALWIVLWLGAALFMLVKLDFLKDLLQQSWFVIPVTAFAFSCAIHITDVRPAIVRGIRTLLLVLLSWILPITTLIVAGFLVSLSWTGLAPLWATRHATSVLLGASAVLVVLINAAFQNGEIAPNVAKVIRISARAAVLTLLPIAVIAVYSLNLRVNEYGWTTDRIIAAACLVVATCYALGYAWAACRRSGWLEPVATVNIVTAFVILGVLLSLFSPIADPARLSVNDQMARLASGQIKADKFDFDYLKFEGARYGLAALNELKVRSQGADAAMIREKAEIVLKKKTRWATPQPSTLPADVASNVKVWPKSARLPESFVKENWSRYQRSWELPLCLTQQRNTCDAYLIDFDDDNRPEVLLIGTKRHIGASLLKEDDDGHWTIASSLPPDLAGCESLREKMQAGEFRTVPPRLKDLEIGGQRIEVENRNQAYSANCSGKAK